MTLFSPTCSCPLLPGGQTTSSAGHVIVSISHAIVSALFALAWRLLMRSGGGNTTTKNCGTGVQPGTPGQPPGASPKSPLAELEAWATLEQRLNALGLQE